MGQSGFMVKKRNLPPLLSFSALLVCILPHCRSRAWCGNLWKASGHVVCRPDQSVSFRIFDSTFYFPHSAIPHFTHSPKSIIRYEWIFTDAILSVITKSVIFYFIYFNFFSNFKLGRGVAPPQTLPHCQTKTKLKVTTKLPDKSTLKPWSHLVDLESRPPTTWELPTTADLN